MSEPPTKGKLFIFSAPSGSGKTSIVKALLARDPSLAFSVSCTTRAPRPGEKNGVDYYFITPEEFKKKIEEGAFAEWEMVYKDLYYGTLRSEVERLRTEGHHVVFDVDVEGGLNLKKLYGSEALAFFVKPPSLEVLEQRLRSRNTESEEMVKIRFDKARRELEYENLFDRVILNDNLEEAVENAFREMNSFKNQS
jgi:guanylate kinase